MTEEKKKEKEAFSLILMKDWEKWLNIKDPDLAEALDDFSGSLNMEMRKMTAIICKTLEDASIKDSPKQEVKDAINKCWYDINSHQKVGNSKLCFIIKKYLKNDI